MRARLALAAITASLAGMLVAPAGAVGPFKVLVTNLGSQTGTAELVWRLSGQFIGSCQSPAFAAWTDPTVPGIDSKAVSVSSLGLGSTAAARKVKLEITSFAPPVGAPPRFDVRYMSDSIPGLSGCRSLAETDSGASPLTVTVPAKAEWVTVTPVQSVGASGAVEFTANKV